MVKCPFCGFESSEASFRTMREPWRFRFYVVKRFECPKCRGVFQYYTGISSRGRRSEFTIRVKPRVLKKRGYG
ncbi:MAG: hypothetical protein QXM54_01405 [Desulfurococcaceae archaeon]|uniref:Uncharacterized protein n=1 Tax=Staphylothermus marinus TaxID=2280 RepID=A0A7J3KGZ6_STAMA